MTEPTLKPGTRCECRNPDCPGSLRERTDGPREACRDNAVRLVTVPLAVYGQVRGHAGDKSELPMCEPCSQFHEAKHAAR